MVFELSLYEIVTVITTSLIAIFTFRDLKERLKDRKILYIEERLEKLYYPIRLTPLTFIEFFPSPDALESFHKFQYLGSQELKIALEKYYNLRSQGEIKELSRIQSEILEIAKREIPQMEKELNELRK